MMTGSMLERARGGAGRVEELVLVDGRAGPLRRRRRRRRHRPATAWLAGQRPRRAAACAPTPAVAPSCPDVFAAGDASIPFEPRFGVHARTEHWDAAAWQGAAAARAMLGEYPGTPPLPSFWSDQYGVRIQYVGHAHHADAVVVDGRARRARLRGGLHPRGHPRRRPRGRSPAGDPGAEEADRESGHWPTKTMRGGRMTYIPVVDPNECSAHGDCVEIAPEVFASTTSRRDRHRTPEPAPRGGRGLPGGGDLDRRRSDQGDCLSVGRPGSSVAGSPPSFCAPPSSPAAPTIPDAAAAPQRRRSSRTAHRER